MMAMIMVIIPFIDFYVYSLLLLALNLFIPITASYIKLSDKAFIKSSQGRKSSQSKAANESDDEDNEEAKVEVYMNELEYKYESSIYSSSSDESDISRLSPVPDDANST